MSPPEDSVFTGASQRVTGSKTEGGIRCGGVSTTKEAEANCQGVGMRPESTTQGLLLEHSELLRDVRGLLKSWLKELKGLQWAVVAMGSAMDDIVKWMSWVEEGSRSKKGRAWSI